MSEQKKGRKPKGLRKDKRVQVTLTVGRNPDGSPKRKSFYGKSRTEALKLKSEYIENKNAVLSGDDYTVSEWIEQYKATYRTRVNPAYLNIDDVPYNRLSKEIGNMVLSQVCEMDLQDALNKVAGMSKSTIDTYRQTMRRVFERARKNKLIMDNPADDLMSPSGTEGTHRALERWESDCILANWSVHRCGIWVMIMLLCGLRRGEMMALRWEHVDMEKRRVKVCEVAVICKNQSKIEERTKSESGIRILPMCQPLWDALNQTPEKKRAGLVCLSSKGKRNTESSFSRGWSGFLLAMERVMNGEPVKQKGRRRDREKRKSDYASQGKKFVEFSMTAHDLRHTFATALFEAGVPAKAAQYYLGHADIRITLELYTHLSQEKERASSIQLTNFLDSWLNKDLLEDGGMPDMEEVSEAVSALAGDDSGG